MTFDEVLTAAVNEIVDRGFVSIERMQHWTSLLRQAAERVLKSPREQERVVRDALTKIYVKLVERGGVARAQNVALFTVKRLTPAMRRELDKRIMASAELIKLNRREAINKTIQRFQGWATSVPEGGTVDADKRDIKANIKRSIKQLSYVERRLVIDQGHKLTSSINEVVAVGNGAVAVIWHSHWRQPNYDYREDHKERDGQVYLLKGSWADQKGFVKPGNAGWYEDVTKFGEEVFCRCYGTYIYQLSKLPDSMITNKGREALQALKKNVA